MKNALFLKTFERRETGLFKEDGGERIDDGWFIVYLLNCLKLRNQTINT